LQLPVHSNLTNKAQDILVRNIRPMGLLKSYMHEQWSQVHKVSSLRANIFDYSIVTMALILPSQLNLHLTFEGTVSSDGN
jgi:hypothetical protein